ncbi:MAG: 30S ribosomal protein S16 [Verrucomicrobiae bacterium]|nr:30S ribosomal protein S16 [Verrucomicrobiae bacterium]
MAVHIRLKKIGTKNDPVYRIVVADSRSPRDGRNIEQIGTYDPRKATDTSSIQLERVEHWVSKGAQLSDTVRSIYNKAKAAAPKAA